MTDPSLLGVVGKAIEDSTLATAIRESAWGYPAIETIHIVGFVLLVGAILVVDLRLIGFHRDVALAPLARLALPISAVGAIVVVPTGVLLFVAHAGDLIFNVAFIAKLVLIAAAVINASLFHAGPYRTEVAASPGSPSRTSSRLFASASIALWIAVLAAGRLIAYV